MRFGAFEIDLRTGELRKHGIRIRLQDQPFQILQLLLERPGDIVTREELRGRLWAENTFIDFDVGLNAAIKRLREALGDSAESSHYIETLPRRGYRFIAHVEPIRESTLAPAVPIEPQVIAVTTTRRRKVRTIAAAGGIAALATLFLLAGKLHQPPEPTTAEAPRSIAVLPLENLSGDPAQEYFADGMTDALTTELGRIGQLRVVSRTSTARFKNTKESLQQIARELDVDTLVEGGVARSGDRIRITANLVQVSPEKHLWSENFETNLRNVLDVQDEASRAIANAIQINLTPQEKARLTTNHTVEPLAYDAYLQGRYFVEKTFPAGDGKKPLEYFRLAAKYDPAWALPYTGIAEIYMKLGSNLPIPNDSCAQAKGAALEALKRDSGSPEAHAILADVEYTCEWNWAGAEREAAHAIEMNPNFAQAHSSRGRYLLTMGRTSEMLEETGRAVELDPLAFRIRMDRWASLYMAGRYNDALEQCQKIKELDPSQNLAYIYCGDIYLQQGKLQQAIQEHEKAVALSEGRNPRAIAYLGYAYALAGRQDDARKELAVLQSMSKQQHVHPYLFAVIYAGLGEQDAALDSLDRAYDVRARDLLGIKYDPVFTKLRTHPRFVDLIRRIGFTS